MIIGWVVNAVLRTTLFTLLHTSFAVLLNILILPLLMLRPLFPVVMSARLVGVLMRSYGSLIVILTWLFAPTTLVLSGGAALSQLLKTHERGEPIVLTSNHLLYLDWWYLWILARQAGAHGSLRIILKADLKHIPIFGWAMQYFGFLFLKRKWALDKKTVKDKLSLYLEESQPFWLLLFPEGTLLDEETVGWSNAYIKKMDLQDEYAFEKVLLLF
ncbi:MAG: hypothetical protein SGCHY_004631 [Lobulomycetales sp.]